MFDENEFLNNKRRSLTLIAKTNIELIVLTKHDYNCILQERTKSIILKRIKFFDQTFLKCFTKD